MSDDKQDKKEADARKVGADSLRPPDQQGDVAEKTEKSKDKAAEIGKEAVRPVDQQTSKKDD